MKKIVFLGPVLLFLFSCVAIQPIIKEDYDKVTNLKRIYLIQNLCPQNKSGSIEFNMVYHLRYASQLWISIKYFSDNWLYITAEKSLVLLIDGEKIELSGEGSFNRRHVDSYGINETARYLISKEMLDKLAQAHKIEGKLFGMKYYETFYLDENNLKAIRKFKTKIENI